MKFVPYIKHILLVLCIVVFVAAMASYDSASPRMVTGGLDLLFTVSAVLIIFTIVAAIAMPLVNVLQNPKSALRSLLGLVLVAAMFFVAYGLASEDPITLASGKILDNVSELKFADTALYSMYIAFGGVILSIVGTEIYKIFK